MLAYEMVDAGNVVCQQCLPANCPGRVQRSVSHGHIHQQISCHLRLLADQDDVTAVCPALPAPPTSHSPLLARHVGCKQQMDHLQQAVATLDR
jgi:hypothetical protein